MIKKDQRKVFIWKFGKLTQYFCIKSIFWTIFSMGAPVHSNCRRKFRWSVHSMYNVNGYCYISREINCFLKSFWVVSIKNAGFSKLETRFSCFKTRFVWGSSIVPVLSRHTMLLLSLPDLCRKIEGPLLAGNKWETTTTSKIDLSSDISFWIFWLILSELHLLKMVTFWGKTHCHFPVYILLFEY